MRRGRRGLACLILAIAMLALGLLRAEAGNGLVLQKGTSLGVQSKKVPDCILYGGPCSICHISRGYFYGERRHGR